VHPDSHLGPAWQDNARHFRQVGPDATPGKFFRVTDRFDIGTCGTSAQLAKALR
jgi:hypothetical protein